jgi:hypothetical protein
VRVAWQPRPPHGRTRDGVRILNLSPRFRLIVGYGAIACAVPYLALKIVWLAGGTLGVADRAMMSDPSMFVLNLVTAGMDVIAIALALAFTHAWGQRIPAWLVLPPAWVATGLLVKFVLAVPLITAAGMLMGRSLPDPGGPVRSWVYVLVYTEFVGMGMGLAAAFVAYARVRWSGAFDSTANAVTHRTRRVQVPLANSAALMAGAVGALHLGWALGATLGVPGEIAAGRTFASTVVNFVDGATMIGGAIGVVLLVHRPRRPHFWVPLALAWIGSGFLFAWGLWGLANLLGNTALVRNRPNSLALINLVGLIQLLAGLSRCSYLRSATRQ